MSQPAHGLSLPGGTPGARRRGVARRRASVLAGALLVVGTLGAPSAALAVNGPPVAHLDTITGAEDTVLTGNVLANDTDPEGDVLTVVGITTPPTYGTLVVTATGDLTFTPPPNYHGKQYPAYWVSDGTSTVLGYIILDVTSVNDVPVAHADAAATDEDVDLELTSATLVANDTDADGDPLVVVDVSGATHGTAVLAAGTVTFSPAADWCGPNGGFDYTVSDGHGGSDTAAVTIAVACVNDPPVANADSATILQGAGATTFDVTANDSDVDGDPLTVVGASVDAAAGSVSVASASSVRFTPAALFEGDAAISYTISDGHGGTADGTLTVTVVKDATPPVPAAPVIRLGSGRVNEKAPVAMSWSATDAGGIGVAGYEVQVSVNGGAWTPVSSGAATSATAKYAFGTKLTLRMRATDGAANVSGWVVGATRTVVAYQAPGSRRIVYRGAWTTVRTTSASGVGYRYTTTLGRSARLSFTGREVLYVAPKRTAPGRVKVYVDGTYAGSFSLRASAGSPGRIIFRRAWATSGTHTIRIVNARSGRRASLDAFVVLR